MRRSARMIFSLVRDGRGAGAGTARTAACFGERWAARWAFHFIQASICIACSSICSSSESSSSAQSSVAVRGGEAPNRSRITFSSSGLSSRTAPRRSTAWAAASVTTTAPFLECFRF